jgi:lysozyme family protein
VNANFPKALGFLLESEGGFVNDPRDPGGATDEGVTQHQYDLWRIANRLPTQTVSAIGQSEVEAIYKGWYWNPIDGDTLPSGVDYCVFDCAVNSGPHMAAKWLQQAAGVPADGQIGNVTISAVNAADPRRIIDGICSERLAFMQRLPTWSHFEKGWSSRVTSVGLNARSMVS